MAVYQCSQCGQTKETRCKPSKCPECGSKDTYVKQENQ